MNLRSRLDHLEQHMQTQQSHRPCWKCGHNYTHAGVLFFDEQGRDVTRRCSECGRSVELGAATGHGKSYDVAMREAMDQV